MSSPKNTFSKKISATGRRAFLRNAALGTGGLLILPSGFLRGQNAPSNRITVACVGVGGQGDYDSRRILEAGAQIVGICDVDRRRLQTKSRRDGFKDAEQFEDYREMFDKIGKKFDAVSVSTPDHTHFTVAHQAIDMGKHVYVQKPLVHTVDQARRLTALAKRKKVITQMGNQGTSLSEIYTTKEWYEAGLFGDVSKVLAWTNRPVWKQGFDAYEATKPTPDSLNWDLWLGCAPEMPYHPGIHPFQWRGLYSFGTGALGDMAAHVLNAAYNVLELGLPTKIEVNVSARSPIAFPNHSEVIFHFPKTAKRGPIQLTWVDGANGDRKPKEAARLGGQGSGSYFEASKVPFGAGEYGDPILTFPEEKLEEFKAKKIPQKYYRVPGANHYQDWIDSIKGNKPAISNFEKAGIFTEIMLLGVIAQRVGRNLEYDPVRARFKGDEEANRLLKAPKPRKGFLA